MSNTPKPDWQAILQEHSRAVWSTAYRLLTHVGDADDCFQQTFADALRWTQRGRAIEHWRAFLVRLATARALDRLRERYRHASRQSGESLNGLSHPAAAPDQLAGQSELAEQLRRWIAALPPKQADAFSLHAIEGLSYREVADALQITVDYAGVLISRARVRLRQRYAQTRRSEVSR